MFVYGTDLNHTHNGRMLIRMDNVYLSGADGKIDYDVKSAEEAIKLFKSKTGSNEYAYEWHKSSSRLIEKPPSSKVGSGATWSKGQGGILFMYADEFIGEGTGAVVSDSAKLVGTTLAILAAVSMIASM